MLEVDGLDGLDGLVHHHLHTRGRAVSPLAIGRMERITARPKELVRLGRAATRNSRIPDPCELSIRYGECRQFKAGEIVFPTLQLPAASKGEKGQGKCEEGREVAQKIDCAGLEEDDERASV